MKKHCTECGIEYPRTKEYFSLDKRRKDGLSSWCRKCHCIDNMARKKRNRVKYYEQQEKYRQTFQGYVTCLMRNIKNRCNNPKATGYNYWGGRGIKCEFNIDELSGWLVDNNIDPRGLEIHRIDNNGNYVLDNIEFLDKDIHIKSHRGKNEAF